MTPKHWRQKKGLIGTLAALAFGAIGCVTGYNITPTVGADFALSRGEGSFGETTDWDRGTVGAYGARLTCETDNGGGDIELGYTCIDGDGHDLSLEFALPLCLEGGRERPFYGGPKLVLHQGGSVTSSGGGAFVGFRKQIGKGRLNLRLSIETVGRKDSTGSYRATTSRGEIGWTIPLRR